MSGKDAGRPKSPTGLDQRDASPSSIDNDASTIPGGEIDPVYEKKAKVLNRAIQDTGMGRYQWQLFIVVGFGWASDNLWPIVTSLILTPVVNEFHPSKGPLLSLSQNIGLLAGAMFWGFGCDVFGRKPAFNLTLGTAAFWGMVSASSPSFAALGVFAALWSFGVGGNLPVDSAIFLEFLPASHQYLLTVLSVDWALAQVLATLVAWPLLGHHTCQEDQAACPRAANMGWRYFVLAMGGVTLLMCLARLLCFRLHESPKYLMGRGRDDDAVRVVHDVARRNGRAGACALTVADLKACEPEGYAAAAAGPQQPSNSFTSAAATTAAAALRRRLETVKPGEVRALFATPRLARSTGIIMAVWGLIGLAYPLYNAFLPFILATRGAVFGDGSTYVTYRNSLIVAATGVPGALVGGALVEVPRLGRRGTLAASTVVTGTVLLGSTTAASSGALLGWDCAFNFASNVMYAVLYSYSPELFPTPQRGTGNALTATCNRIFGIMAPIIAMFADLESSAPVYTSGALFIAAGVLVLFLPFESRGKAAL